MIEEPYSLSREEANSSDCFFHAAHNLGILFYLLNIVGHRNLEITPPNIIDIFAKVLEYNSRYLSMTWHLGF